MVPGPLMVIALQLPNGPRMVSGGLEWSSNDLEFALFSDLEFDRFSRNPEK